MEERVDYNKISVNCKNKATNDDDVGYESWTEGSWCLFVPTIPSPTTLNTATKNKTTRSTVKTRRKRGVRSNKNKAVTKLIAARSQKPSHLSDEKTKLGALDNDKDVSYESSWSWLSTSTTPPTTNKNKTT
mmetsp:Transcript_21762/g.22080  ORF Transcript_21762/g.22080 Transcript_21762/m.22080 type:complete len:131 (+) Transcript_21762:538-930(+)